MSVTSTPDNGVANQNAELSNQKETAIQMVSLKNQLQNHDRVDNIDVHKDLRTQNFSHLTVVIKDSSTKEIETTLEQHNAVIHRAMVVDENKMTVEIEPAGGSR